MNTNIVIAILCLFNLLIIMVKFFSSKNIDSDETKLYKNLFYSMLLQSIFGIMLFYTMRFNNYIFQVILNSFYIISIASWITFFSLYVIRISCNEIKQYNKIKKIILIMFGITAVLTYVLPRNIITSDNGQLYATGAAVMTVYIYSTICLLLMVYYMINNFKNLIDRRYIPVLALFILGILTMVIQSIYPELFLFTPVESYIVFLMYFTIENPDMKLLNELHKSKEISDTANEEKTMFLYNMTQEIKEVANKIDDDADLILDSKNYDEIYDSARDIKARTSVFVSATNDILNMSSVDSNSIKVYNERYNIKTILKQIISIYSDLCENKTLKFRTNIDHDIPDLLYGDGIGLKEVLITILNNCVKYTSKGFIELSINTIIKGDICRLIITVEDSGIGIKSEDINNIRVDNKSLAKANKLITLMNGTMLISSEYGIGTKIKIILDQKMVINKDKEIDKYEKVLDDIKLLVVDDSEAGLKIIEKLLKGTKINLTKATTGKECIDNVKANKYDLILLDEELSQITANELMVKLKEIRNFKVPVVLLTKDNSYEYNEEYLKQGFIGYMLKPLKKDIFINEINKYSNNN